MKKVYIVNCFETYNERVSNVKDYFESNGYNVVEVVSDFHHMTKEYVKERDPKKIYITVPKYKKNLSLRRLFSHYNFSRKVVKFLKKEQIDMLYVLIPPNFLSKKIIKNFKSTQVKIIFDVIDIWPEAMNIDKIPFIYSTWKKLRNNYIYSADNIITECDLFNEALQKENKLSTPIKTVYFTGSQNYHCETIVKTKEEINICYLGSINNIINIDKIIEILNSVKKNTGLVFHIIGDGEKRELLLSELKKNNIKYIFYGKVYDEDKKKDILLNCDFGLNIMKEDIKVGLTMKSIEYFRHSLPIINNIKYDTEILIKQYKVGINVNDLENYLLLNNYKERDKLVKEYKKNVKIMYDNLFNKNSFYKEMDKIFEGDI